MLYNILNTITRMSFNIGVNFVKMPTVKELRPLSFIYHFQTWKANIFYFHSLVRVIVDATVFLHILSFVCPFFQFSFLFTAYPLYLTFPSFRHYRFYTHIFSINFHSLTIVLLWTCERIAVEL